MKATNLFKALTLMVFTVSLLAPFTFLKPLKVVKVVEDKVTEPVKPKIIEKPLHSVKLPDFASIKNVREKKKQFFDFLRPEVIKENESLLQDRAELNRLLEKAFMEESFTSDEEGFLSALSKKYKVSTKYTLLQKLDELLMRVDVVPISLVLVQAANESAWGTSRFARIGLNFFGIWCYRPTCGMVPNGRNKGAKHEVAAFKSVASAVQRYLHNINTNNAYIVFRTIRSQLREQQQPLQAEILATGLLPYSERGTDYVLEITEMIRHNQDYFVINESD